MKLQGQDSELQQARSNVNGGHRCTYNGIIVVPAADEMRAKAFELAISPVPTVRIFNSPATGLMDALRPK